MGKNRISLYHSERRAAIRYPAKTTAQVQAGARPQARRWYTRPGRSTSARSGALLDLDESVLDKRTQPVELSFAGRDGSRGVHASWVVEARVVRVEPRGARGGRLRASRWPSTAAAGGLPVPATCSEPARFARSRVGARDHSRRGGTAARRAYSGCSRRTPATPSGLTGPRLDAITARERNRRPRRAALILTHLPFEEARGAPPLAGGPAHRDACVSRGHGPRRGCAGGPAGLLHEHQPPVWSSRR